MYIEVIISIQCGISFSEDRFCLRLSILSLLPNDFNKFTKKTEARMLDIIYGMALYFESTCLTCKVQDFVIQ